MSAIEGFALDESDGNFGVLAAELLAEHGVHHGFTTRVGGALGGPRALQSFGSSEDEPSPDVQDNLARLGAQAGFDVERLYRVRQIHSDRLVVVEEAADPNEISTVEADALVTAAPGHVIAVQTADCVPVLLFDQRRKVVGVAHCGWRGLVRGVLDRTISVMANYYGGRPVDLLAVIGPSIGACCFEVAPEVAKRFAGWEAVIPAPDDGQPRVDLRAATTRILVGLGLTKESIVACDLCTRCRSDLFFSYRGLGAGTGRHLNFIGLRR